jgi:hypothetical protein
MVRQLSLGCLDHRKSFKTQTFDSLVQLGGTMLRNQDGFQPEASFREAHNRGFSSCSAEQNDPG